MKKYLYLLFALIILTMSWDLGREDTALAASNSIIPEESIRLRIIANSDSVEDQWLKQEIRDLVTDEINLWVGSIDDIDEARDVIEEHIPQIEQIVNDTINKYGFKYSQEPKVELGIVEFPTKMYGETVYPAGEYEALRITLGEGQGQNWWCVLFPPLCFVDISSGDAVQLEEASNTDSVKNTEVSTDDVQIRFFLGDLFAKLGTLLFG